MNANNIKAQGTIFEDMRFVNIIPKAVMGSLGEKKPVTFRIKQPCPVVTFERADLTNSRWGKTELLQVNPDKTLIPLSNAKVGVSFNRSNISEAHFSNATLNGESVHKHVEEVLRNPNGVLELKLLKEAFKGAWYNEHQIPKLVVRDLTSEETKRLNDALGITIKG